jgi:long-chain acyl-CoA synthetase
MPIDKFSMKFVYNKIKNALGGKFIKGISGGGALPHYIEDFFEAIGVALYVGYGLTETSPVLSVRREENNKIYSVGPAVNGTEFMIVNPNTMATLPQGEKGLILVKGPQVMLGYFKDEEATAKVMYGDWFITGDLGWLTQDGNLVITGRMKEIIVLSNGENIEAEGIEDVCLEIPYINQIVITGQDMPYLTALIYLNQDEFARVLPKKMNKNPNSLHDFKSMLLNEINKKIKSRNNFRSFERIANITFLKDAFTVDNGMMTQSLKIKKNVVSEHYKQKSRLCIRIRLLKNNNCHTSFLL